jgi:hypothetical protein
MQHTTCHTLIYFTCLVLVSTPQQVSPIFPHYPHIFWWSVASSSCLVKSYQRVFPFSSISSFSFLVLPVLTILPALTLSLPAVLYLSESDLVTNYESLHVLNLPFACPVL